MADPSPGDVRCPRCGRLLGRAVESPSGAGRGALEVAFGGRAVAMVERGVVPCQGRGCGAAYEWRESVLWAVLPAGRFTGRL